jgi:Protein of unknown function (DUF3768)
MTNIADLNDRFRRCIPLCAASGVPGQCVMTAGIAALGPDAHLILWDEIRSFDRFTEDNDPYGQHDFGAIELPGAGRVFWKIDYYAPDMMYGSEDPADLTKTVRVLTIMLAMEY